jgi:hypothetical protein
MMIGGETTWPDIQQAYPDMVSRHCFDYVSDLAIELALRAIVQANIERQLLEFNKSKTVYQIALLAAKLSIQKQPLEPLIILREPLSKHWNREEIIIHCRENFEFIPLHVVWVYDGNHRLRAYQFVNWSRPIPFVFFNNRDEAQRYISALRKQGAITGC